MDKYLLDYISSLTGKLYKILPLANIYKDNENHRTRTFDYKNYVDSLIIEMSGSIETFKEFSYNSKITSTYISVINTLHFINQNGEKISTQKFRSEIFKCINLISYITKELT